MPNREFTVADLIEYLKTQDQEAIAQVIVFSDGRAWEGGTAIATTFDPKNHSEYMDLRNNQWIKSTDSYYNKRYLILGSTSK